MRKPGKQACPAGCGKVFDGHSVIRGVGSASKGNYSLCIGCCAVLRFDSKLKLHAVPEAEIPDDVREVRGKMMVGKVIWEQMQAHLKAMRN